MIDRFARTIICGNSLNTRREVIISLMVRAIHKCHDEPGCPDDHDMSLSFCNFIVKLKNMSDITLSIPFKLWFAMETNN